MMWCITYSEIFLLSLPILIAGSYVQVVSDPQNQFVADRRPLSSSDIGNVLSLSLGFSTEAISWEGLTVGNIFQRPQAAVFISIKSHNELAFSGIPVRQRFPVNIDGDMNMRTTSDNIQMEFGEDTCLIIEYASNVKIVDAPKGLRSAFANFPTSLKEMVPLIQKDGSILQKIDTTHLNMSFPVDLNFLSELQLMKELLDKLIANRDTIVDGSPDLIYHEISSIAELQSVYGTTALKVEEAEKLLNDFLKQYFEAVKELYGGDVLIMFSVLDEEVHRRYARAVEDNTQSDVQLNSEKDLNVATNYDADFSAMFNIVLWTSVALAIAVYAVAYMLWNMDPGDSIIYRMTSQRIKID